MLSSIVALPSLCYIKAVLVFPSATTRNLMNWNGTSFLKCGYIYLLLILEHMTNYLAVNSSFHRNSVNKSFLMFVHGDPKRHGSSFSFFCRLTWEKEAGKHVTTLV